MHIGDVAGFFASLCACINHWRGGGGVGRVDDRRGFDKGNWLVAGLTTCKASGEYTFNSLGFACNFILFM